MFLGTIRLSGTLGIFFHSYFHPIKNYQDLRDSHIDSITILKSLPEDDIKSMILCKSIHEEENTLPLLPCGRQPFIYL